MILAKAKAAASEKDYADSRYAGIQDTVEKQVEKLAKRQARDSF